MRVSQIQNLTWAGNVLVLGVVACLALQFWRAAHERRAPAPDWAPARSGDVGAQRWPGERSSFDVIVSTPIGGPLPAPPPLPTDQPTLDPEQAFRAKLEYLTGLQYPDEPEMSLAFVKFDGKERWIRPGDAVGGAGFRFVEFTLAPATPSADTPRLARLVFNRPDGGEPIVVEQPDPPGQRLVEPRGPALVLPPPDDTDAFRRGLVPEAGPLGRPAYRKPNGDWVVTDDEQLWIEAWGDTHLLPNLGMKPESDAEGKPRGVRITGLPESKTPLAPSHGLALNDIVKSIDKVPVHSKEEIVEYLRGPGRGRVRYEVVVEANGAERTVVYLVPRRIPAPPAKASRD